MINLEKRSKRFQWCWFAFVHVPITALNVFYAFYDPRWYRSVLAAALIIMAAVMVYGIQHPEMYDDDPTAGR